MADRKLRTYVHLDGQVYGPGDEVPADVAKRITNPDAWEGEADSEPAPRRARRSPAKTEED